MRDSAGHPAEYASKVGFRIGWIHLDLVGLPPPLCKSVSREWMCDSRRRSLEAKAHRTSEPPVGGNLRPWAIFMLAWPVGTSCPHPDATVFRLKMLAESLLGALIEEQFLDL
jgi:hypothetical protein